MNDDERLCDNLRPFEPNKYKWEAIPARKIRASEPPQPVLLGHVGHHLVANLGQVSEAFRQLETDIKKV